MAKNENYISTLDVLGPSIFCLLDSSNRGNILKYLKVRNFLTNYSFPSVLLVVVVVLFMTTRWQI